MRTVTSLLVFALVLHVIFAAADSTMVKRPVEPQVDMRKISGEIKTVFGSDGRPVNQSQTNKGFHRVSGKTQMVNGRARVTLNTSTVTGKQDVSFNSSKTYKGIITIIDTINNKTYRVIPQDGKTAIIISSDSTDTASIIYTLEGE